MQANVGRETEPERTLRRALHAAGLRYRKDVRPIVDFRCKADVVFTRERACVFVDGCFWHGCPEHFRSPRANEAWWLEKITATVDRDSRQTQELEVRGWRVIRVWEHEIADLASVVQRIRTLISVRAPAANAGS